ncbi:carbonic anhydrase [Allonocardiopsis opalescens]|uniref:Carbonic anhydrase n=1 Tax=Allonocardiopsis opalescens TaxID=1144618 RepID=A0A2T0Q0D2_9ACTN|nr:carbonic anhydrase [Allonocardiopsis opalescens]PRX97226.1 carbonic anhydrase [Allonocardiopsis opalescens]
MNNPSRPTRRRALGTALFAGSSALLVTSLASTSAHASGGDDTENLTPDQALALLHEGNRRYRRDRSRQPHLSQARREETAGAQHPFALVLGCLDSRVPVEHVFDRGIGDLAVVRTGGQVLDASVTASVTYGGAHLHVPLIMVLGHSSCGAVTAAVQYVESGETPPADIEPFVTGIRPAVEEAMTLPGDDLVAKTIDVNARQIAERLRGNEFLAPYIAEGALRVVSARYDLASGRVHDL